MLKCLVIFLLSITVFSMQTHAQTYKTKQSTDSNKPTAQTSLVAPQQTNSPSLQPEAKKDSYTDVRVISTPAKDRYDKAAFWETFALVLVGIAGIVVAVVTLLRIHAQAKEMRLQRIIMHNTLNAMRQQSDLVKTQAGHMGEQTGILKDSVAAAKDSARAANDQIKMMKTKERARITFNPLPLTEISIDFPWQDIEIAVGNFGQTDAVNVLIRHECEITASDAEPERTEFSTAVIEIIRPSGDAIKVPLDITISEQMWKDKVIAGGRNLYAHLWGVILYEDIFSDPIRLVFNTFSEFINLGISSSATGSIICLFPPFPVCKAGKSVPTPNITAQHKAEIQIRTLPGLEV